LIRRHRRPDRRRRNGGLGLMPTKTRNRLPTPGKRRELIPMNATMEADPTKAYNQDDATGFIRLNGLRLKVAAKVHGKK